MVQVSHRLALFVKESNIVAAEALSPPKANNAVGLQPVLRNNLLQHRLSISEQLAGLFANHSVF